MKGLNGVSLLVNSVGEFYFALDDFLVDHHRVVVIKGVDADEHFVEEDAEGPPVDRLGMAFIQNNLRRQVLGRAAEGVSLAVDDFRETEVR